MIECPEYQLGTGSNAMVRLPNLNIPDPFSCAFTDFSVRNVCGDLSVRGGGYPIAVWTWEGLSLDQLFALASFWGGFGVAASATVYVRTRTNGIGATRWKNYQAVLVAPVLAGDDGTPPPQGVPVYQNVSMRLILKQAL